MDSRSNRLCPTQQQQHSPNARQRVHPQKLVLRRRCRSECLPMSPIIGIAIEPKQFDDLNELRHKQHQPAATVTSPLLMPIQQQQPNFRKYATSASVLRNQDSAKNIFSHIDQRQHRGSAGLLKNSTKENISSATPSIFQTDDGKDICMRDFELYKEKAIRSNLDFMNKFSCIEKDNCVQYENDNGAMVSNGHVIRDTKRRVRARSESEPHEMYQSSKLSPQKYDKSIGAGGDGGGSKGYDVSLSLKETSLIVASSCILN